MAVDKERLELFIQMADTINLLLRAALEYEEAWNRFARVDPEGGPMKARLDKAYAHQRLLNTTREYRKEITE